MMPTPRLSKWFIATIAGVAICVAGSKTPAQVGDDVLRFEGHSYLVTTVAFSPDGKRLLVQSGDGVTIHDATTGKRLAKMEGPRSAHGKSVLSPDGKFVAGVVDFQLNVWDSATGKSVFQSPSREIYGNDENVIAYSPDGKLVATPELVLKASDGVKVGRCKNSNGDPLRLDSRVLFSPDGEMLMGIASVSGSKKVITCRLPTGLVDATTSADVVFDTDNPLGDAADIALSADGRVLARLKGRAVALRMLAGGTQPDIDCEQPEFRPTGIAFHPGGKYVALAGERSVQLFDVQTGKSAAAFNIGEGKGINSLAFSPDGSRMALGMWEQPSVLVWDVLTGIKARIAAQEAAAKAETERLAEIERKTAEIRAKRAEEKRQAEIEAAALRERMKQQTVEREAKEAEAQRLAEIAAASRREQMQKEAAEREVKEVEARRLAEIEVAAQKDREKQLAAAGIAAAAKTASMGEVNVGAKSDSAKVPVISDVGKQPTQQAEKVDNATTGQRLIEKAKARKANSFPQWDGFEDLGELLDGFGETEGVDGDTRLRRFVLYGTPANAKKATTGDRFDREEAAEAATEHQKGLAKRTFFVQVPYKWIEQADTDNTVALQASLLFRANLPTEMRLSLGVYDVDERGGAVLSDDGRLLLCNAQEFNVARQRGREVYLKEELLFTRLLVHVGGPRETQKQVVREPDKHVLNVGITNLQARKPQQRGWFRRQALVDNNWDCQQVVHNWEIGFVGGPGLPKNYFVPEGEAGEDNTNFPVAVFADVVKVEIVAPTPEGRSVRFAVSREPK